MTDKQAAPWIPLTTARAVLRHIVPAVIREIATKQPPECFDDAERAEWQSGYDE